MNLNDEKIRALLSEYRQNPQNWPRIEPKLRAELELYAYRFPRLAYRQGPEICSDFYLWVVERLEACVTGFPLERSLKFKTWWNAVLRNQFTHFMRWKRKSDRPAFSLDLMEEEVAVEAFAPEEATFDELREGLSALPEADRLLLLFHHLPESLSAADLQAACRVFELPVSEVLAIRSELVRLYHARADRTRDLSQKLTGVSQQLSELRIGLHRLKEKGGDNAAERMHPYMAKIARGEALRARLARDLATPDRETGLAAARLFRSAAQARSRLDIAARRLKYEVLTRMARPAATA